VKDRNGGGRLSPQAAQTAYPNENKPWSNSERRTLSRNRNEGADAIAEILGRSPKAVQRMAEKMRVSLRVLPGEVCPVCGIHEIRPHTAAARHGMCPTCWTRKLASLREEEASIRQAERDYQAAKKRAQRSGR
jgi:rubrerythrin